MAASRFTPSFFSCATAPSSRENLQAPRHVFLPTQLCRFPLSLLMVAPPQHNPRKSFAPVATRAMSTQSSPADLEELIKLKNSENPAVVYSKSWCPYCLRVKSLFKEVRVKPFIVELDELADEGEVQVALERLTGQSTVPNVFIGGKHVGGCEDTLRLHHTKKLIPMLEEANAEFF